MSAAFSRNDGSDRDRPFFPVYTPALGEDLLAALGGPAVKSAKCLLLSNSLLISLALRAYEPGVPWTRYWRDKNRYRGLSRYHGGLLSYAAMMGAVSRVCATGLFQHEQARPAATQMYSSRIRWNPEKAVPIELFRNERIELLQSEQLVLRDENGRACNYRETSQARCLRRDIRAQNEALQASSIRLLSPNWAVNEIGLLSNGVRQISAKRKLFRRIFNVDFYHGGRWYAPWWQQLNSCDRKHIRIDSNPTIEIDYPQLHPRLIAAAESLQLSDTDDLYQFDGFSRRSTKLAVNVLLNANSLNSARRALSQEGINAQEFEKLVDAINQRFPSFTHYWGSGIGRRLQCVDAAITANVQSRLRAKGVIALSVHDSYLVEECYEDLLQEEMARALNEAQVKLTRRNLLRV